MTDVDAKWRPDNAKSPAAVLQENNPDATCMMSIPRMYYLVSCSCTCDVSIYNMSVSKLVTTSRTELVSRMKNRHGRWVCWVSIDGKSNLTTHSKQQR